MQKINTFHRSLIGEIGFIISSAYYKMSDTEYDFDTYGHDGDDYGEGGGNDYGDEVGDGDDGYGDDPTDEPGGDEDDTFDVTGDFKDTQRTGEAGGQPKGTSKMLQRMMREPHEKMWIQVKPLLKNCIEGSVNSYEQIIRNIPRIQYLNPPLLGAALCYIATYGKTLTSKTVENHLSGQTAINPIDFIRYVKMVSNYV
jgi:hypothetical protein